ncbi:unnamed protein product [Phytomonas sp. Hart1]|nr:unnamed protein product [Phytomonas sp. Hart1]|eukprot:CCW66188.1 unnamed protein product [Phytomonas sp. isolate Hart1]
MTPNGGAMTEAVRILGYTPYLFEMTLFRGNFQTHLKEWYMVLNHEKKFSTVILEIPQRAEKTKDKTGIPKENAASTLPDQAVAAYDALVGPPATLAYETILQECPRSTKVILVEEADKLLWESEFDRIFQQLLGNGQSRRNRIGLGDFQKMVKSMTDLYKATSPNFTRGSSMSARSPLLRTPTMRLASALDLFEARVKDVVPRDRLLVYREGEGWGPICAFLRLPVPTTASGESCPFPPHNSGSDIIADLDEKFYRINCITIVMVLVIATMFITLASSVRTRMKRFLVNYNNRFMKEMGPFLKPDIRNDDPEAPKPSLRKKLVEAKKVTMRFENEIRQEGGTMSTVKDVIKALFDPHDTINEKIFKKNVPDVGDPDSTPDNLQKTS